MQDGDLILAGGRRLGGREVSLALCFRLEQGEIPLLRDSLSLVECVAVLDSIRPRQVQTDSKFPTQRYFPLLPPLFLSGLTSLPPNRLVFPILYGTGRIVADCYVVFMHLYIFSFKLIYFYYNR